MIKYSLHRAGGLSSMPTGLKIPDPVLDDIGQVVAGSIIDNVTEQKQADGTPIKVNPPGLREKKRREGRPVLSLIYEKFRFVRGSGQSWFVRTGDNIVTIEPATDELRDISRNVQERGYVGWFAPSAEALAAIKERLRRWIVETFRRGA